LMRRLIDQLVRRRTPERGVGMAVLRSPREIELMRAAGRVVHQVLEETRALVKPGVTTGELAKVAEKLIRASGGEALFKGVRTPATRYPFPAVICTSVNEQVVHGIPGPRVLTEGDIVSIDCGVRMKGYCGDAATTIPVGRIRPEIQKLLDVTAGSLDLALGLMKPGKYWSEIAAALQQMVESAGFSVVREFVGHGIGTEMHEDPKVPNYAAPRQRKKEDFRLESGLVIAVEPMVNAGTAEVKGGDSSGWPQVTRDGRWSAHFEHTVAISPSGVDVLTDGR
jgi:methionyl aminopeptidase